MKKLLSASLPGTLTGLLYGILEYAAVILDPMLRWGPRSLGPEHWFWETVFLAIYVISGAAIGAAAGLLPGIDPARSAPRAVTAATLMAVVAGRLRGAGFAPAAVCLDFALLLMAAFAAITIFVPPKNRWLAWMSSPWVLIPLALASMKAGDRFAGPALLAGTILFLWMIAAAAVLAGSRFRALQSILDNRFVPFTAIASVTLLAAMTVLTIHLDAAPPIPAASGSASPGQPNILLIVLDTVRADHLSAYGYARRTTPHLETFAREGVLFRSAISAADMTLSSYASMYTSLYPSWHGALTSNSNNLAQLDKSFVTLAEMLAAHGYFNMAVLANHGYLNREFGMQQGFHYYDVRPPVQQSGASPDFYLRSTLRPLIELVLSTAELDRMYRRSDQITDGALRLLASRRPQSPPFFLSLNYMGAHEPYIPPASYRNRFPGLSTRFRTEQGHELREELAAHRRTAEVETGINHIISQYDASLAFMDDQLQRLLEGLRRDGLYDNTMIVVTSDHGEALGERDDLGHPASVHQELVHVPLIIKYPRAMAPPSGQQIDTVVSGVDLMPTILDVAGIPLPKNLQGRSLHEAIPHPGRVVISESFVDAHLSRLHRRSDYGQRAFYQGPWKLIVTVNRGKELYNRAADPGEVHDLYTPDHPAARQLTEFLDRWLHEIPHQKNVNKKMEPGTLDRLRGLGYIN